MADIHGFVAFGRRGVNPFRCGVGPVNPPQRVGALRGGAPDKKEAHSDAVYFFPYHLNTKVAVTGQWSEGTGTILAISR